MQSDGPAQNIEDDILRALRRITRSIDLHSRKLANTFGLTGPQLVCLRVIAQEDSVAPSQLAREVSLSQGTITGILDRLSARQLIERKRSSQDRRVVTVHLTQAGRSLVDEAPSPLQERFVERLGRLSPEQQQEIRDSLERVVLMMDGEDLDAAPILAGPSPVEVTAGPADPSLSPDSKDPTPS